MQEVRYDASHHRVRGLRDTQSILRPELPSQGEEQLCSDGRNNVYSRDRGSTKVPRARTRPKGGECSSSAPVAQFLATNGPNSTEPGPARHERVTAAEDLEHSTDASNEPEVRSGIEQSKLERLAAFRII